MLEILSPSEPNDKSDFVSINGLNAYIQCLHSQIPHAILVNPKDLFLEDSETLGVKVENIGYAKILLNALLNSDEIRIASENFCKALLRSNFDRREERKAYFMALELARVLVQEGHPFHVLKGQTDRYITILRDAF